MLTHKKIINLLILFTFLACDFSFQSEKKLSLTIDSQYDTKISTGELIKLSKEERTFLDKLGKLKILVDDNFAPISFYNTELNKFTGIAIETLKILSKTLQFDYEIIRNPNLNWADRLSKIKSNEIHILGGASKNTQRKEYGYFTNSVYFRINYALIGSINNNIYLTNISQIKDFKIGLVKGSTINNYIIENLDDTSNITYFDKAENAMEALKVNEIDIFPRNEATFYEEFFQGKRFDFEIIFSIHEIQKDYAFFCPKTEEGKYLTNILDKGMNAINISRLISKQYNNQSIYSYYKEYTDNLHKNIRRRNILLSVIFSGFFLTIIAFFVIKNQKKHKEQLIQKLENALTEVKTLSGLLPICARCKKIRDEKGYWKQIESYIESNTDAQFSHGLCENCTEELYGNDDWYKKTKDNT